jgi:hypothetical protein
VWGSGVVFSTLPVTSTPHLPIDMGGGGKKSGGKIEKSGEKFGFFRES